MKTVDCIIIADGETVCLTTNNVQLAKSHVSAIITVVKHVLGKRLYKIVWLVKLKHS